MENEELVLKNAYLHTSDDIKKIINSSEWVQRVKEIGKKYSLTPEQVDALGYEILFTFLNIQSSEILNETVEEELDISSILAEQIVEEVEERIFAWAMKKLEQKQQINHPLDIPPLNLPGEEIVDTVQNDIVQTITPEAVVSAETTEAQPLFGSVDRPLRDEVKDFFAPPTSSNTENFSKTPTSFTQKPISLTPPLFIAQKLTQVTKPTPQEPQTNPASQTYTVDPYREPLN